MKNILSKLSLKAASQPDCPALLTNHQSLTYSDFHRRALSVAGQLGTDDCKQTNRIVILSDDYETVFVSLFAVWLRGSIAPPLLNPSLTQKTLQKLINTIQPSLILGNKKPPFSTVEPWKGSRKMGSPFESNAKEHPASSYTQAMLQWPIDPTGNSKEICLSFDSLFQDAQFCSETLHLTRSDRPFTPPYCTSAITRFQTILFARGTLVASSDVLSKNRQYLSYSSTTHEKPTLKTNSSFQVQQGSFFQN